MNPAEITGQTQERHAASLCRIDSFLRKNQCRIVTGICIFAAIRIFIFSAAFPLFNSTDEQAHLDTIYEYSHGHLPSKDLPLVGPEMARVFTLYESAEYLTSLQILRSVHMDIPIAELPADQKDAKYQRWFNYWITKRNTEAQSPPVYYLVAAVWYKLGATFGVKDWALAYWVRFLNVILYALFVWVAYLFVKLIYPERDFLCVGVPALLAVFPQDVFFGINRDILSPLLAASVLLLLFRSLRKEAHSYLFLIAGGFLTGISFLTDISNWVLFGVLAVILYFRWKITSNTSAKEFRTIAVGSVGAIFLPALWMALNYSVLGDLTGSKAKIALLGWTVKPWNEIWSHPIFSLHGMAYFLGQLMRTFWRGEYLWQGNPMRSPIADGFYVASSYLLLIIFAAYLVKQRKSGDSLQQLNGFLSLYLFVASFLFLAVLSLPFDFHQCFYPSRALPYFVSGRIICGALLPLAIIYVAGFEYLFSRIRSRIHPIIPFAAICLLVIGSEFAVSSEVFQSAFNFFSLIKM